MAQVAAEVARLTAAVPNARTTLEAEFRDLEAQVGGWARSLANPALDPGVRAVLEANVAATLARQVEVRGRLVAGDALEARRAAVVDPQQVADRLNRLSQVLGGRNPTRGNIELGLHVAGIACHLDGRVVVTTCKLGALAGGTDLLAAAGPVPIAAVVAAEPGVTAATPRRLARRHVGEADLGDAGVHAAGDTATDANRFAGLGREWFWTDEFQIPVALSWTRANAAAVGAKRKETGWTHEVLAAFFGKTLPTIRAALEIAREHDPALAGLPTKMPRARWIDSHFQEVMTLRRQGMKIVALGRRFGISPAMIRQALALAEEKEQEAPGDPAVEAGPHPRAAPDSRKGDSSAK